MLLPLQSFLSPGIHKTNHKDQNKNNDRDKTNNLRGAVSGEIRRPREEKHGHDIQRNEEDSKCIIVEVELNPCFLKWLHPTFVCIIFNGTGFSGDHSDVLEDEGDSDE